MNNNPNINAETIEKLRRQLKNRIDQVDSAELLSRCMAVIDTAQVLSEEDQDDDFEDESDELTKEKVPFRQRHPKLLRRLSATLLAILLLGACGYGLANLLRQEEKEHTIVTVAKDYETIEVNGYKFNMVRIEGGTFWMGATKEMVEYDYDNDEAPAQQVTVSSYSIGETEVTQGLWFAVMGARPLSPDGDDHPMKEVSHDECLDFIAKLNRLTGRHFHLPTEAQWEFAARGGNYTHHYLFAGSNDIEEVAWYSGDCWDLGKEDPNFGNHAVAMKKPNELGLYDMSGNVWEWCHGSYERFDGKPKTDPTLNEPNHGSFRCNRGGSWDYIATSARVSNRRNRTRDFRNFNLGLRLAE